MDMPIPDVSAWEWASWKFPRPVLAGDTVYARWTLTQKRAPVRGSKTSIAVWRVDVHTAEGALCAEGEVGASVFRATAPSQPAAPAQEQPQATNGSSSRRRRRKRGGTTEAAAQPAPPAAPAAQQPQQQQEPRSGGRRRRRRRSSGGGASPNENHVLPQPAAELPAPEPAASSAPAPRSTRAAANPLSRVMKRLRGT